MVKKVDNATEKELIALAKSGNKKAMCKLLKMHEGFLYLVTSKYSVKGFEHKDFLQIARLSMIKAVGTYNPELNCKLLTHAIWIIKSDIQNITRNTIRRANEYEHISLDAPVSGDSKHNVIDTISDDYDYDIHHDYSKLILKCMKSLRTAKQKMAFMVMLNNYLNDDHDALLKDIGKILNVGRERARQIRNDIVNNETFAELRKELVG